MNTQTQITMRMITETQFLGMKFKTRGYGKEATPESQELRRFLQGMEVGQRVHVLKREWPLKSGPAETAVAAVNKSGNRRFRTLSLKDNSGWVISRVA